ncbi:MAG: tRNA (adenosine(37)-N6)-threonylcarbamoyltransferase complex transferase subunit TsaD [Clostridia bacterium]|nr:tRNA (adenosine(37)-N6)-threonylcarbamoyltransferase complex transferase subunit TsaD [Clostridia bacterium]
MIILSIETSCDETSVAVTNERQILSNVVATQIERHKIFGGVVPEIASRMHSEAILPVCNKAIENASITYKDIDAIAVTYAPGLIGALLVGVNFAKGLALSLKKPLIPVHHLRSHIAANYITHSDLKPPFLCLLVSGGNSVIARVNDYTDFQIIGRTHDDAAGECFDKCARAMGLDYPGGVNLDKIATEPDFSKYPLPVPSVSGCEYDFSFSGLKTAVVNLIHNNAQKGNEVDVPVLCATLKQRVCDILCNNTLKAAKDLGINTIAIAGGVSANSLLRKQMQNMCKEQGFSLYYPELKYCGDNAAMVGVQGYYEYLKGNTADESLNATATMPITEEMN